MTTVVRAAMLGLATGIRSTTPLATISWAANSGHLSLSRPPFALLGRPWAMNGLVLSALSEMVSDKLPFVPSRTALPVAASRVVWGGVAGAAAFAADKKSPALGAPAGAVGALAGTYGGDALRTLLSTRLGVPNPLAGSVGDAVAVALSLRAVKR